MGPSASGKSRGEEGALLPPPQLLPLVALVVAEPNAPAQDVLLCVTPINPSTPRAATSAPFSLGSMEPPASDMAPEREDNLHPRLPLLI